MGLARPCSALIVLLLQDPNDRPTFEEIANDFPDESVMNVGGGFSSKSKGSSGNQQAVESSSKSKGSSSKQQAVAPAGGVSLV
jgi:hypothetical protein